MVLSLLLALFAVLPGLLAVQYVTFVLFVLWWMVGFALMNSTMMAFFPDGSGKALSTVHAIAGLISLPVGQWCISLVDLGSDAFFWIHVGAGVLSTLTAIVLGIGLCYDGRANATRAVQDLAVDVPRAELLQLA